MNQVINVIFGNRELQNCQPVQEADPNNPPRILHYVELAELVESRSLLSQDEEDEPQLRRPKVRCDTEETAKWVIALMLTFGYF